MKRGKEVQGERRFQLRMNLSMVVIGAILGFAASQWLQFREESSRKQALVRLICATIRNDLNYTIVTTEGLRDSLLKNKISSDPTFFRLLYHPSVVLPDSSDMGLLSSRVVSALDEYRRRLTACETERQEHLATLLNPVHNNIEITLLTYVIGLDSVILTGADLLRRIESQYPEMVAATDQISSYSPLQAYMGELQKAVNDATADRLKNKAPQRQHRAAD